MPLNPMYPWELINKELKPQIENALDAVKRDIFKGIVKPTLLKRPAAAPSNP